MPTQQAAATSRSANVSTPMDQARRREMVCNLLIQIFMLAERTRAARRSVSDEEPISLIELIQASYSVFERYGIGPPDDAVYHRYLLSLSINPERDWRKKILNFDLASQPRVKRLYSTAGHRHAATAASESISSSSVVTPRIQRQQRGDSKRSQVRQASLVSDPSTPVRKSDVGELHDRFGDMLSLDSPIQEVRDRNRQPISPTPQRRVVPLSGTSDEGAGSPFPSGRRDSAKSREFHMITASIEQWRATQAVKQLMDQSSWKDSQSRKQRLIALCTHAVFHWITLSLPEKIDFDATESPQALPLCILRRISVNVNVLKKSVRRVRMWQMKMLLYVWHQDAQKIKSFRIRMLVKTRAAALEIAFQCIQHWRLFTETVKCSKDRAQWVAQRRCRTRLRNSLQHWRRAFLTRKQQHQVDRHHSSRTMRKVLNFWRMFSESKRDERRRYEMARKQRIFSRWKCENERRQAIRALLCVSADQRRLRLLSESWIKLRANVSRNQTSRTRLSLWEAASKQRRRRQFLRFWRLAVDQCRDFWERQERFHRYARRRHLRQFFVAWVGWTEQHLAVASILSDATEARASRLVSLCFENWRRCNEETSNTEEDLVALVIQLRRRGVWHRWRRSTVTRSATRILDSAFSLHLLARVFTRWKQHTTQKADLNFALLEWQKLHRRNVLALHWKHLVANLHSQHQKQIAAEDLGAGKLLELMRVCLLGWQKLICGKRECRLRGDQLQYSIRCKRLMHSTWTRWRQAFWLKTVTRLADDQLHGYRKSHTFRLWKQIVFKANQRHDRALQVVELLGSFYLHACFRQWKGLLNAKHKLARKLELTRQMAHKRLLMNRWKTWRRALETKRDQHKRLSAVASRWQHRKLYASFHSWKTTWSIRKRHRHLLQTTLLSSEQRVLDIHFNTWRKQCRIAVAREVHTLEVQDKLMVFKMKRALRCWNNLRLKNHRHKNLLVKYLGLWRQKLLSSAFKRLQKYRQRRKQKKSQTQQVQTCYRKQSMQRVFTKWSAWSRSKEQVTKQCEAVRHRLDILKMLRVIQNLKLNAHSRKRLRTAHVCVVAMRSGHSKIAAFSRWKNYIAQRHSNKRDSTARLTSMKIFRMRRRIHQWRKFVDTRKVMKHMMKHALIASTASLLQKHLANWKKFVTRQAFTLALKQKATAFRYFCLLPLYFGAWKTSTSAKKHKQSLLLRARGLWCHQSESRAFKAWMQFTVNTRQTKRAVTKWQNQTISRVFVSWTRFIVQQRKDQRDQIRAVNYYERRICHHVLRNWSITCHHDRLARSCAKLWYETTSRRTFSTWTHHVRLHQSSRKFLAKMRNQTLARVFTTWKRCIEQKSQQLQGIQERFALLWMVDTRQNAFARWKRFAYLRSFVRKKLGGQREFLLQDIVKQWRRVIVSRHRSRQRASLIADRAKFSLLKMIWSHWHAKARVLCCVKALRGKVTENRVTSDLRQRVRRWKQVTVLSIAVKTFMGRQDIGLMRAAFIDGFQRFVQLKRNERELVKKIGCVHETYLKAWLVGKLQHRMSVIAKCEDLRRSGSTRRLLTAAWVAWTNFHARKQTQQTAVRQLRVQVSRLQDQGSSLAMIKLAGILCRWQNILVTRVFERWNFTTQAQQQARLHTLKAMEWWHKMQCGRYFSGWNQFCKQQRKQKTIRTMSFTAKLKRTWNLWKVFKATSLGKKAVNRGARQYHAKNVYRSSFSTWRATATSRRARREQILELYHSSRLRLLAALVGEWRKFAAMEKTKHMQRTIARVVHEEKLTSKIFLEWKTNVDRICYHRRQLQANTERLQVLLLCSSFRAWNSWSEQHKKMKTIIQVLTSKCDSKTASRIFTAWHLHADKVAKLRHQASAFLHFRRMQKGVKALRNLTQEQAYRQTICEKAQLFRTALTGNQVADMFSRWKKYAALSRKTRSVTLRYLQNKLLPGAWSAWVAYVKIKHDAKDKTLAAALCWKNAFLRKAWNALMLVHKVEKKRHGMVTTAELHYDIRRLRKTLAYWCIWSKENQHFRSVCGKLLARWRMQAAYRCFCALHDHAEYRKVLHASEITVKTKVRTKVLLQVWYAWRKLLFISHCGKRRLLLRCWTSWIRSRESRKVLQEFREQIQAQVLRSTQRRCFANWKQFVATRKIEKAMVLMSSAFAGTQLLKRVWLCWLKFVTQTRAAKSRMRDALVHMHLQLQFKAFRAIQVYSMQQKWKIHANVRVLAFRLQRLQTGSFQLWKTAVKDRICRRQKLGHYLNMMQHSVQMKTFGAWFSFASRRKLLRSKVSQSLAMRTQLCSRLVFQTWKSFVLKVQRNRVAQGFCDAKTSAHALKHWRQYVVLRKIERMIGANEQRQVEASFLSWRKAIAATHQIRAFRAKSARRHWLGLVGIVFQSWKHRSHTHAHCRKLLASVAVGNHLRFRFMLWQRFTAHRKRLANLLLVVADPPTTLAADTQPVYLKEGGLASVDNNITGVQGEQSTDKVHSFELTVFEDKQELRSHSGECDLVYLSQHQQELRSDRDLVALGQQLAKKARIVQRFEVTWDLPQAWHRWRQIFHAQLFYRMRRQQFYFIFWQKFAREQRRNRWIVIKLTNQRQSASLHTIFWVWAELVGRVKQLQKDRLRERELWILVTTEMARRERRQIKAHWHAWKFRVEETRHLRLSLDAYHRARLLTKFWLVWHHDYRQIAREARREAERVQAHMQHFLLHRALRHLRDHQQRSKRARLVLEYFGNRRYDMLLPEVLDRWRKWSQRQKEITRGLEAARMNKTRRHFSVWKAWKNTRKWQRIVVNSLHAKSFEQRRRDVWIRWWRYVKKQVGKDVMLQKATIFHVCSRLRKRWQRCAQQARQLRDQAETAHLQLCAFRGHRAVRRWREYSRARRLRRLYQRFVLRKHLQLWQFATKHAVAMRFDEFLLRAKTKKLLVAWRQVATKQQYWRKLSTSFMGKKENQIARGMFVRWQQLVNARQGKRLATMHAEQRMIRKVWRCWNRATLASQLRHRELIEQAAEHAAQTLMRQSMGVWQAAARKQRERRFVLLSCVVKLNFVAGQRVQEVIFHAWKRVVDHERRCRAALLKRDYNTAKRALFFWFTWTRDHQRSQQLLENAANYHSQRLRSAVFFYWQTYALAWQDAAKPIARRHDRQMVLPAKTIAEPRSSSDCKDSEDSESDDVRRPISPVVKRLRQKKANQTRVVENIADSSDTVTLSDAVEISIDVKKRLLLLGNWKPQQRDKSKAKLLPSSS